MGFGRSGQSPVRSASTSWPTEVRMRACSDSIAKLTGALAKAQSELVNPPKSLSATLERGRNGGGGTTYRYVPLSAGLEIVRKTLGKHELAVMQTTSVDEEHATVVLTTILAH